MKSKIYRSLILIVILISTISIFSLCAKREAAKVKTGSVIFIHPDGSGAAMWGALRMLDEGPDGFTNWDRMGQMGVYRGHMLNSTNASSNGGATVHAFGVKVPYKNYGINPQKPFKSLSGKDYSVMTEAKQAGKGIALINSGHLCEPGTGAFVANAVKRANTDTISAQIIHSGAEIILGGGEELLLPKGVMGRHGKPGKRKDGRNLIEEAKEMGYTVVYTKTELLNLPLNTEKVLGVFAPGHTFNDQSEEDLERKKLPLYHSTAPSVAEMTEFTLKLLNRKGKDFLLVVEEEGTDNFANSNNAKGTLEALRRADGAIGASMKYIENHPKTLLLTAADSNAGGMHMVSIRDPRKFDSPLPATMGNGAPIDGINGTRTLPFVAVPDQFGKRLRFGITWAAYDDLGGGVVAKAHGLNSQLLPNNVDNTDIYRMMYATLFGKWLGE